MSKSRTKKTIKAARKAAGLPQREAKVNPDRSPGPPDKKTFTNTGPADFSVPWDIDPLYIAFPTNTPSRMPKMEDIPEDAQYGKGDYAKWKKLFNDWFFAGLSSLNLVPRDGIDQKKAIVHIRSIMGSFDTQHEHKEATCVYLLHKWFSDATWEINHKRLEELSGHARSPR